jgi:hypothetical protein
MFATLIVLVSLQLAAAGDESTSVVRRSFREYQQHERNSASARHCVVWHDVTLQGQKFHTKSEADEIFEQKKQSELAAFQSDGSREVRRYLSKRMKNVDFAKMKAWCDGHRSDASYVQRGRLPTTSERSKQRSEMHVATNGALARSRKNQKVAVAPEPDHKPFLSGGPTTPQMVESSEPSFSHASDLPSLFQGSSPYSFDMYSAGSAVASSVASSLGKASTLTDQVSLLEGEVKSVVTKVSSLLKQIGSNQLTATELSKHQSDSHGKLKLRLADLEEFTATLRGKTSMLESELFGTTSSADTSMKQAGHSFKEKIEAVAGQVDEVKSRVSAIEGNSLLGEAAKLEEGCRTVGAKVGHLFAAFGIDGLANPAATVPSGGNMAPMKARLITYSGYADNVMRDLAKLEYEVLGNSYNIPDRSQKSSASIKESAAMLAEKLNDIQGRATTVANAPISNDVKRMEAAASSLSSRASALAKRVGLESKITQLGEALPPQGPTLKVRAAALEAYLGKVQSSTALLEDELAGNAGEVPAQLQKDSTLKSQVKLIEQRAENLNARLSTLEQQV